MKDKKSITKCKICGKPILINCIPNNNFPLYHKKCIIDRSIANDIKNILQALIRYEKNYKHLNIPNKTTNIYYKNNSILFNELLNIVEHFYSSYFYIIRHSKKYISEWIDSQLKFLDNTIKYNYAYKSYCILFGLQLYPKCKHDKCKREMKDPKSFLGMFGGFRDFCSNSCALSDLKTQLTILNTLFKKYNKKVKSSLQILSVRLLGKNTCLKLYGCENGGGSLQAMSKSHRKYIYDNKSFDSKLEIIFYIWLKDHSFNFKYHDGSFFTYKFDNKNHRYYPDFYIEDKHQFYEIKGKHFFKLDGTMYCPPIYKKKTWTKKEYKNKCALYLAKYTCMIENNVKIITDLDPIFIEANNYVNKTYGKSFLSNLKNKKKGLI